MIVTISVLAALWFLSSVNSIARELRKMNEREDRRDKERIYGKDA